jgi:hypothetical protein
MVWEAGIAQQVDYSDCPPVGTFVVVVNLVLSVSVGTRLLMGDNGRNVQGCAACAGIFLFLSTTFDSKPFAEKREMPAHPAHPATTI